ncbi:MAG: hypothetical protein FWF49_04840 [Oscillospiraceae bacterium]|nr:hypothetical protein [Oscillospiraceae bacterium]
MEPYKKKNNHFYCSDFFIFSCRFYSNICGYRKRLYLIVSSLPAGMGVSDEAPTVDATVTGSIVYAA